MRRFVVGTAGHVDHGKTTLVGALTGVDTDRLPEEKRRGISIELGFAPLDLGDGTKASIVDVPGHRRLVRTMIAGASGIELVMLVVAADEGVMPQTREHAAVCELLGIGRAVVIVTKSDCVDVDLARMAADEAKELLAGWQIDGVVTCSARTGQGMDAVRRVLRDALASLPEPPRREHARLGVDRVFAVRGAGTVVTGTLVAGHMAVGDELLLVSDRFTRRQATARALHVHDSTVENARAPTRLAINLGGVTLEDVRRGDVVTTDATMSASSVVDLRVAGEKLARGASVTVHVGTASTAAKVDVVDVVAERLAIVRLRLAHATVVAGGDRIVLRGGKEGPAGAVVGGGVVVDARPDRRASGAKRRALALALASLEADKTARSLVESSLPRMLLREALGGRFAVDAAAIADAADLAVGQGVLARVGDGGWTARSHLEALVSKARSLVVRHQEQEPLSRGLPLETLRGRLALGAGRTLAQEAIRGATTSGSPSERLVIEGDVVRTRSTASAANTEALASVERVAQALRGAGAAGATEFGMGEKSRTAGPELRAALQKLARDGAAARLGDLWFAAEIVDEARRRMVTHFERAQTLSVVEFKGIAGLARKQAVLFLEHFDRLGLTRRSGEARVLR